MLEVGADDLLLLIGKQAAEIMLLKRRVKQGDEEHAAAMQVAEREINRLMALKDKGPPDPG